MLPCMSLQVTKVIMSWDVVILTLIPFLLISTTFNQSVNWTKDDFNAKYWRWCASDKNIKAGLELDKIATTSGYNQMIDKTTHGINESSSCINLVFSSNVILSKNCGFMKHVTVTSSTKL